MHIVSVVGARPNFMKLAPVARSLAARPGVRHTIVHTGQHYDADMSDQFFRELSIPAPDVNLGVGSGSHAQQTASVMQQIEPVLHNTRPDWVLVYGDVNSTMAATLVAAKLGVPVAHVEAGLRSRDLGMPEEINRLVTDRLAQLLLTPSADADENLLAEGVPRDRIRLVGNVMIDSLVHALPAATALDAPARHGVSPRGYVVVTLHRPSNVDDPGSLREIVAGLAELGCRWPVLFPVHPRTRRRMEEFGIPAPEGTDIRMLAPLGYLEMLGLVAQAGLVLTDSGGLQEESSYLGIPCLTARPNTERPVTVTHGTNRLVASERGAIVEAARGVLDGLRPPRPSIPFWDGRTGERIADIVTR